MGKGGEGRIGWKKERERNRMRKEERERYPSMIEWEKEREGR